MNRSTETTAPDNTARIARAAWLCAFVVPLLLAMLLLGVRSTQAAPSLPSVVPLAFEEEPAEELEEEEAGEFGAVECEIAEEELTEGEIDAAGAAAVCAEAEAELEEAAGRAGRSASSVRRCPLRSARARAVTRHGRLKLTLGYTAERPFRAAIQVRKGSIRLGSFRRKLGRSGVVRLSKRLGRKASGKLVVRVRVPKRLFRGRGCGLVQVVADKVV